MANHGLRDFLLGDGWLVLALVSSTLMVPALAMAQDHHGDHHHDLHGDSAVEHWLPRLEGEDRDAWQRPDEVVEILALRPGMVVADIGAGTGYFLSVLSAAVGTDGKVLGLDVESDLVQYMQERIASEGLANAEARLAAFDDPGLGPASVDRVLIVNTWHHIHGREAYANKLAAALAKGGKVYVIDFTEDSPHGPPVEHRLLPDQVRAELEAGGLATELIDEDLPYQYVVVGRRAQR